MRPAGLALPLLALPFAAPAPAADKDAKLYELRVYTAAPGKLDALHARFRDHTLRLLQKHGGTNVGYFVPAPNPDNKLYFVLGFPDQAGRDKTFAAFGADPDWKNAVAESEKDGKLVTAMTSQFLTPTDYSPAVKPEAGPTGRVFELRLYTASAGNLANLNARFRDHTVKLFEKHGMTNVAYWTLAPGQPGEDAALIYLLAHADREAMKKSWAAFRADPEWNAARTASEQKAGGPLTAKDGVKSVTLAPTDYSPMK